MTEATRTGLIWLATIIVAILCAILGFYLYWHLAVTNTDRRFETNVHSQAYRQGLIDRAEDIEQGYDDAGDSGLKVTLQHTFCATYRQIIDPPTDLVDAASRLRC